jgi:hypothetical protein
MVNVRADMIFWFLSSTGTMNDLMPSNLFSIMEFLFFLSDQMRKNIVLRFQADLTCNVDIPFVRQASFTSAYWNMRLKYVLPRCETRKVWNSKFQNWSLIAVESGPVPKSLFCNHTKYRSQKTLRLPQIIFLSLFAKINHTSLAIRVLCYFLRFFPSSVRLHGRFGGKSFNSINDFRILQIVPLFCCAQEISSSRESFSSCYNSSEKLNSFFRLLYTVCCYIGSSNR